MFYVGVTKFILYSLLIDAPKRTNKAKLELRQFQNESGIIEDDLS